MDDDIAEEVYDAEIVEADINELCRICGSTSDSPLVPIYEENGLVEELASKIMLYLPIKISEDDALPVKVCVNCANGVLTWHLLFECCVDADRRFQAMLSEMHDERPESPKKSIDGEIHIKDNILEQSMKEEEMHGTSQAEEHEMEDVMFLRAEFGPEDEQYLEDETHIADGELDMKNEDQSPMKHATSFDNFLDPSTSTSPITSDFIVLDIQPHPALAVDVDDSELFGCEPDHDAPETTETTFTCPSTECLARYSTKSEFCAHLIEEHKDNPEFLIKLGHQTFKVDTKIIRDARIVVDGRRMFKCPECEKCLSTSYCFKNHLRIHTNEKPYVCFFCNKSFRIQSGIARHIQTTHLQIKKFSCDICNKKFTCRDNLRQHLHLHTDARPYVCNICGKGFKQKASLFFHTPTHSDVLPFKCAYCGKGFRFKRPMLYHLTVHTGEKSIECDICGKMFRLRNDLTKHLQLHNSNKPFKCSECPEAFKQKRYLSRHLKSQHASSSVR